METPVNRRIRDKAMVFGLPADRFMVCLAVMCAPVLVVLFVPVAVVLWIAWMIFVYKFFRRQERFVRSLRADKRFPACLKNR